MALTFGMLSEKILKFRKISKKKIFKSRFLDISDTLLSARHYGNQKKNYEETSIMEFLS